MNEENEKKLEEMADEIVKSKKSNFEYGKIFEALKEAFYKGYFECNKLQNKETK